MKVGSKVAWIGFRGNPDKPYDPPRNKVFTVDKINNGGYSLLTKEFPLPKFIIDLGGVGWKSECWKEVEDNFTNALTRELAHKTKWREDEAFPREQKKELNPRIFTTKAKF